MVATSDCLFYSKYNNSIYACCFVFPFLAIKRKKKTEKGVHGDRHTDFRKPQKMLVLQQTKTMHI